MNRVYLAVGLSLAIAPIASPVRASEDISRINGRIVAEAGHQYGTLNTVNGGIVIGEGGHTGRAKTVNGGISVGTNAQTGALATVNGSIRIRERAVIEGGIETVNGGVFVDRGSEVRGDLETVNGSIGLVETRLDGDIETVSGDVTVGAGSHVAGGIMLHKRGFSLPFKPMRKPRVVIGPRAVVEGDLHFEREVILYVHRSAKIGAVSGATERRFDGDVAPDD